jgi:hypothetical protein
MSSPIVSSHKKQWGRKWRVTVKSLRTVSVPETLQVAPFNYVDVIQFGSDSWLPEGLHVKFDTTQTIFQAYWTCDVTVYNLNSPTSQNIIKYGMTCLVEAGYQDGAFGTVFEGTIFQPMWEKENGTDWKLTLHCIVGLIESTNNFIGQTVAGGYSQRDLVSEMVRRATNQLDVSDMDDLSPGTRITRATTYFGQPNDLLQYVADTNNALMWFSHQAAHIRALVEDQTVPETEYSVDNGLIGTPEQTENGVLMKVLLNPFLGLRQQVKLKQSTVIRQQTRQIGNFPSIITQDF